MPKFLYVIDSMGTREPFSFKKVYRSAIRSGASRDVARKIAKNIVREIYPEITTAEIFKKVKKQLGLVSLGAATAFNLKEGMRRLGPTGFPFEKYIGEILRDSGFDVQLNQIIPGVCCSYEIDFIAKKENILYIGECKYHNIPSGRIHLDIALANHARFLDIRAGNFFSKIFKKVEMKSLLVTNTKFSKEAIKYSKCVGVELLGWNYPKGNGLEHLIDTHKLYPITVLSSLDPHLADILASRKIMLAKDLLKIDIEKFSREEGMPQEKLKILVRETKALLNIAE